MKMKMSGLMKKLLCYGMKSFPSDLPEGHVRVYAGKEVPCKFELEANYLNHPLFENLLQLSVDEFGSSPSLVPSPMTDDCLFLIQRLKRQVDEIKSFYNEQDDEPKKWK
ncbi:hypothetical protein HHK36_002349 [Tetracentron sinense]|uniref:Uncharacterized protein n=1 Tax=Tetracentron sinense TaxID=13715 RepID=A0A835DN98_TETSI|nr:hypothetical protein HHK36_002349 [Tetracentron sinense]